MLFLGEVLINMLIAAGVCFRSVGLRWDLGKLLIFLDLLYVFLILSITTKHQNKTKARTRTSSVQYQCVQLVAEQSLG